MKTLKENEKNEIDTMYKLLQAVEKQQKEKKLIGELIIQVGCVVGMLYSKIKNYEDLKEAAKEKRKIAADRRKNK